MRLTMSWALAQFFLVSLCFSFLTKPMRCCSTGVSPALARSACHCCTPQVPQPLPGHTQTRACRIHPSPPGSPPSRHDCKTLHDATPSRYHDAA
ncbi:hypothetical protein EDB83DRAFT_2408129 [Lactarius deliciosus]|nr:hypothetical protein EDB83DRAFT_2408129 [Lactarius deliciosus]